jgi:tetratricopeptide (TPR) repeat protein
MKHATLARLGGIGVAAMPFVFVLAIQACGGENPTPKLPNKASYADAGAGATVVNDKGQQTGIVAGADMGEDLPPEAKDAYGRGYQAWMAGDLQGAKAAFTEAAGKAPKSGSPKYSLGAVLERLGDTQGALDAYKGSFTANPKFEFSMGSYSNLLARTGQATDAESFLSGKQSASPDSVRLLAYMAEVKSIEGDSPGCQGLAQQALTKQPDFKDAMIVIARDYYRNHKWDLAKYALQAILDGADDGSIPPRDKDNAEATLLRALIERETGQRKQALVDFDKAVSKRPDLFEAYISLGEMKLEAGNATEAQAPLEKAVKYAPNVAVAHLDLGDCYRLLGRPGDAKKEFDTALGMDSTLAGVHYNLGLLYLFSKSVPGVSSQDDQLSKAIQELETYKSMRGAKAPKGQGDDVDELLSTAKRKQSELQLQKQAAAQASAAPPAATGSASPPASGAPASSSAPATSSSSGIVRDMP